MRHVVRDDARTGLFVEVALGEGAGRRVLPRGLGGIPPQPLDVTDEALDGVRLVHLTGITMAISESGRALVVDLARRAKEAGATVLFDPNFRPALPDTAAAAAERQRDVLPYVDWYLTGEDEATRLWGDEEIPTRVVLRVGARGAIVDGVRSRARARCRSSTRSAPATRSRRGSPTGCSRAGSRPRARTRATCSPRTRSREQVTGRRCPGSPTSPTPSLDRRRE